MDNTIDVIIIGGQHVPAITIILVTLAVITECGYQLVAHKRQVLHFFAAARSWFLISVGFLLVAMIFAVALVGFWFGL